MKKAFFLSLFFIASPAFGEVLPVDPVVELATSTVVAEEATTTPEIATSTQATTTDVAATTTEVTETITIVPGSLSLKLSSTVPVDQHPSATQEGVDDGIFDLIYTGFEEFVFKVFGI